MSDDGRGRVAAVLSSPRTRLTVFAVVVVGAAGVFAVLGGPSSTAVEDVIRRAGPAAPALYVALFAVLTVLMFPGSVLTIAGGVLFGTVPGTGLAVVGASLGSIASYLIGRRLGREQVARLAGSRMGAIDDWLEHRGFVAVLYARLLPIVPFNVLNYAAAVTNIRFRDYLLASVIGIGPGTFAYTALGGSFRNPTSPVFLTAVGLIVVLIAAGPFANRWLHKQSARASDEGVSPPIRDEPEHT